jgi:hypothetical protein
LRFFSKKFLTDEHIKKLKDSRKIYAKDKVIQHGDNFVEVINYEKRVKVYPQNDELLDMINSIEFHCPIEYMIMNGITKKNYCNYIYDDLPSKLRSYMSKMDAYFFAVWFSEHMNGNSFVRYQRLEDRLYAVNDAVTDEDFEKYVILGRSIPSTLGKKAKDSARRSYKSVNAIIKTNIHKFTTFLTFTFAQEKNKNKYVMLNDERLDGEKDLNFDYIDASDFELAKEKYTSIMNMLKKKLKRKGLEFYYLTVWELQKNGNYHFHVLCSDLPNDELYIMPKWLDYDFINKKFYNGQGLKQWSYGKSDVQKIKSPARVTSYVSKYIIKSFLNVDSDSYIDYLHKKKYFVSQNLDKPIIDYFDKVSDFDGLIDDLALENIDPFIKEFINPYNDGKIISKVYSKITKKIESSRQDDSICVK